MSRPSSRKVSRPKTPAAATRSYDRPPPKQVISPHAGTCLEDLGTLAADISVEQQEAAVMAFKGEGEASSCLDLSSVRQVLRSLNVRLDDSLFQRLVESRWDTDKGSDGKGLDMSGFLRLYGVIFTPAITFGRHLRRAAGRGDEELVRELVLRGCNPNTGSGTGETALHVMAAFGRVDCAKVLRSLCGKELIMQPRDKAGWTPLMIASGNGHAAFMRFLLDEGVDPGIASDSGRTSMHRAAARGRDKALKTLISKKVRVDPKDKCGYTPLHLAAMHDEAEAIRVLLDAGADVEAKDILGYTPRHFCTDRLWQKLADDRGGPGRK